MTADNERRAREWLVMLGNARGKELSESDWWANDLRKKFDDAEQRGARLSRLEWRGIEVPCPKCGGSGSRAYGSTATWHGGAGGQSVASGVCDTCWGSGDASSPWADLRRLKSEMLSAEQRGREAALREVVEHLDATIAKFSRECWTEAEDTFKDLRAELSEPDWRYAAGEKKEDGDG